MKLSCSTLFILSLLITPQLTLAQNEESRLVEQLADRVRYLEDMVAIQQLQSEYIQLLFTQDFDKIVDRCFAKKTEGIAVEFSDSGVYRGIDSVTELYKAFEAVKNIPGFFIMHLTVNPYIVIAKDGLSARSSWMSPGASASRSGARWIWGPYYIDYVKEDGEWRIKKTLFAPVFRNRYENSWVEETDHGTVNGILPVKPDAPPTLYRPYDKNSTNIFDYLPELPEPY